MLTHLRQMFRVNWVRELKANALFLFALEENQIRVFGIGNEKFKHLFSIDCMALIQQLETERFYLPDKSDWSPEDLRIVGMQAFD